MSKLKLRNAIKQIIKEVTETKYTCDIKKGIVYAGKTIIGRVFLLVKQGNLGDGKHFAILQGMNRDNTMNKIQQDCPEFCKHWEIPTNLYPDIATKNGLIQGN